MNHKVDISNIESALYLYNKVEANSGTLALWIEELLDNKFDPEKFEGRRSVWEHICKTQKAIHARSPNPLLEEYY